jgi:hypothetical protein
MHTISSTPELNFPFYVTGKMGEKLLQYIWQFQYFNRSGLQTTKGEELQIIFTGTINQNQGPDFHNAKVKIGNTILAGTIEIHCKTSDWEKHQHHKDKNYRNVILHVVYENDVDLNNNIPVLELESRISNIMLQQYGKLMEATSFIACAGNIHSIKEITWIAWKERLLAERLTRKSKKILELLNENKAHWEETFWWLLARSFGVKVNGDAFEAIARSISINILAKHKNSIHQLEALLFGQANLLDENFEEEYPRLLQREYRFLKTKYGLNAIGIPVHFLRMRPGNFPTIRLAQLAMLIHSSIHLFSKLLEAKNIADVKEWMHCTANDFWHYHYHFHVQSQFKKKKLGKSTVNSIIINTIVPALFAYGLYHKNEEQKTKVLQWLEQIDSESNSIISGFLSLSIKSKNAFDSQALIELKNEYCTKKRCLECSVGNAILKT